MHLTGGDTGYATTHHLDISAYGTMSVFRHDAIAICAYVEGLMWTRTSAETAARSLDGVGIQLLNM